MNINVRWMIRRDLPEVLAIEHVSFDHPWTEEEFISKLRARNVIGMCVDRIDKHNKPVGPIVGYMIYELHKRRLELLNIATHHAFRREGVFTAMIDKLKRKLHTERRARIVTHVRETNLDALLAFRSLGFECEQIHRDYYDETEDDAYEMVYRHKQSAPLFPVNRMTLYLGESA